MSASSHTALRCTLLLAVLFNANAHAETKVGERFGDWVFECQATTSAKNVCALTQTIVAKKDNRRIIKISLENSAGKGEPGLVAFMPLGIQLPPGVTAAVDKGQAFPLIVQTCTQQGCIATTKVDGNMLKAMKSGEKIAISFSLQAAGKPVVVEGSLKGLAEGLQAINVKQ